MATTKPFQLLRWILAATVACLLIGAGPAAAGTGSIHGTVSSVSGVPARGYLVELYTASGNFVADSLVDDLGVYALPNLDPGDYLLRAQQVAPGLNLAWAWYPNADSQSEATPIPLRGDAVVRDFVLQPGASVRGTATGSRELETISFCGEHSCDCVGTAIQGGAFELSGLRPISPVVRADVGGEMRPLLIDGRKSATFPAGALTEVVVDTDALTMTTLPEPGTAPVADVPWVEDEPEDVPTDPHAAKAETRKPKLLKAALRTSAARKGKGKGRTTLVVHARDNSQLRLVQSRHRSTVKTKRYSSRVTLPRSFRSGRVMVRVADSHHNWSGWKRAVRD